MSYTVCEFSPVTAQTGMAKIDKILFSGRAWPAARILQLFPRRITDPPRRITDPTVVGTIMNFEFVTTGRGKAWSTNVPQALWATFADLPLEGLDPDPMVAFLRRWGDPYGRLDADGGHIDTDDWIALVSDLRHLTMAWTARPDRNGIIRCSDTKGIKQATHWWREVLYPRVARDLELTPDPDGSAGLVLRANNLGAYMAASAASALERRVPLRQCAHCQTWFELLRPDARFCSPSCRALSHKQRNANAVR
jgi:hypothetical protein